jgi:RimJ/RimL family protein N-acetyltransferase
MSIPTITTDRLILRAFTEEDAEPLHRILGEKDILHYFPNSNPPALDRVQGMIARQLEHWKEHGLGWWAVEPRLSQELMGWAGLQFLPETGEIEVAYLLGKAFWGQGLATEAARASVQFGFETLGLERIVAIVHVENAASRRVIEKLGMSFVDQSIWWGIECRRYSLCRPEPASP